MGRKRRSVLAVVGALILPFLSASNTSEQQEAIKRLELAVSRTNILDLPSFQMNASVQIDIQGKPLEGSYQLLWNGPEQWREEINLPGYTEIQVGGKETLWIQRSTDFIPLRMFQLHSAVGFSSDAAGAEPGLTWSFTQLSLGPGDTVRNTRSQKEHGEKLTCAEIENELKRKSEMCVSDSTGTLVRSSSYEDREFQPVGGKVFPRLLAFVENGKRVAKLNVSELITPAQFVPSSFTPPPGALQQVGCMSPVPPRLVKKAALEYPFGARERHLQGTVAVDAQIGLDGVPRIRKVVSDPNPDLTKPSLEAIAGWRYEPATCNGKPVPIETVLQVNYTLSVER
jgi:TonB-like protein